MLVGSLIAFAALIVSWMALPDASGKSIERVEAPVVGARTLVAEA